MMENNDDDDDDDAKLKEEIEAELDKISISSLEKEDIASDSISETQSDGSDTDLDELPESVLHCINIIKNKSKTAEELILQDLEDADVLSYSYRTVSNNDMHLRIELSTEYQENPEQLMKILSKIEKEEFLRSKTHCASSESAPEADPHDLPVGEHVFPDDTDINFGYCEVEERCRRSFEAWQHKQKELEDQERETLKAQKDREEKQFQEDEEKRHCWLKQFEVEKKKLENIQKQEQDKMNEELQKEEKMWEEKFKQHEEFIKNLHLQVEQERARFKDLQEKEKMRLLKLQHDAAIKIQANYKAFVAYQKYSPIIKERVENKKKKAQEWKDKEAKIRQREEEKRKRLEEEQRIEEEEKKQKEEELKKRQKEYEEKKNILRLEREQVLLKEKLRIREDTGKQLTSETLKKGERNSKHLTVEGTSKNKNDIAKTLGDEKSKNQEDTPLWLVIDEKSNMRESVGRQLVLKEPIQEQLKQYISNQTILAELKEEEKNENLPKQQYSEKLTSLKTKYENIDKQLELESPDLKENVKEQLKLQELKSQIQKEGKLKHATDKNVEQKRQILEHNQEINETGNNETQKIIKDNQQKKVQEIEKEKIPEQNGTLHEENSISMISMKQKLLPLELESSENVGKVLQEEEINLKSNKIENSKGNALNSDIVIFNTSDIINIETTIHKQDCILNRQAHCENSSIYNAKSSLVSKEANSVKSEIKEIPEDCHENRSEREGNMTCSIPEPTLLSSIEEKRLAWMKSFKPWFEIFMKHQQKKIVKKKRSVKCPANTLPPLNILEILQCGPWNTLQQVTTVTFQDLPGCSLSTLAECTNLQFLSLRRCGLTSLHGLSNCKNLKYIDVQENHIETINCENLENLCILLLNKNQLSSLHGLDGCSNIQNLELSRNKITRIGGLESLKNLQQLILDHNQLISTKGLSDTPTIIYLDCSHNHLTEVQDIANCGLLQVLKLHGNYLSELPSLKNHVLLRELHLDDNSISSVEAFSSYWLPLLQNLTISQNSLTEIIPLSHFISLEKLDVSNNCLSDLTSIIRWFDACFSLRELSLIGNPLLQEINWRHSLLKMLPTLRILNGEILNSYAESHTEEQYQLELGCFLSLCRSQIREFNLLIENYITGKGNIFSLDGAENLCHYFKKLMTLSNEYRYAHENLDVSIMEREESGPQQNHLAPTQTDNLLQNKVLTSCANEHKADSPDSSKKWINSGSSYFPLMNSSICNSMEGRNQEKIVDQKREDTQTSDIATTRIPFTETVMTTSRPRNCENIQQNEKITAAMIIQAYWRGYIVRKQVHFSTRLHSAATGLLTFQPNSFIKSQSVLKEFKTEPIMNTQEQREKAAILIQAVWKGFLLRKKLTTALEAVKNEGSEEEYEEIDLDDFMFDEAALEKERLALDPTRFPSQTQLLANQLPWPKYSGTLKYDDTSLNLLSHPAQAWLCNEKENVFSPEHTQLSSRSENRTLSWTPESKTSRKSLLKSEREEKISEEWGFKDISTAQQMLKRAQKMKSKKLRGKKDPAVRLALFKNNESKVSVTKSPKKAQPRREDYFEVTPWNVRLGLDLETHTDNFTSSIGKEELFCKGTSTNEKMERSREYTYQWLHTQVGVHETTSSRNMKCNHFLPELDPDVLNGGRVQLVARLVSREDRDLDLSSMTSGSALSVNREKKNQAPRHSAGSSSKLWFPSELI
ncbi:leucine-rich repeat and IQ domain-containing protein 1 isoform X3 [Elephas maximus indicus]|uniref:leucine-rich repeat and IQ domain-containing protein 1 isoform X3 n=1 Tax=Elephas maximus indicus TaxID=99487 RepID=UPI0021164AC4|nr:leucine-rich repeat and IQ domain-containing protein 1 isoform X3 [Elephas maximus indicus]